MLVALGDLVGRLQLFVVLVLDAERLADVVDAILVGRRVVAAGRFVADGVGVFPARVDVAAGELRARSRCAAPGDSRISWRPDRAADGVRSRSSDEAASARCLRLRAGACGYGRARARARTRRDAAPAAAAAFVTGLAWSCAVGFAGSCAAPPLRPACRCALRRGAAAARFAAGFRPWGADAFRVGFAVSGFPGFRPRFRWFRAGRARLRLWLRRRRACRAGFVARAALPGLRRRACFLAIPV